MYLTARDSNSPLHHHSHQGFCSESLKDKGVILNVGNPSEALFKV